MRYQEPIYIQNDNSAVRNKDILNVNMSSDICIFEAPSFSMSGASKIDCTGTTGTTYIVTTATTIPLTFNFTGNTDTFTATSATFKYEIYKYNLYTNSFTLPPVYKSEVIGYPSFSGTNIVSENVSISSLNLDGEYLIKGYFVFDACTNFLNQLGKKVDTLSYRSGKQYGLYNDALDYYFIAFNTASTPQLLNNGANTPAAKQLFQQVILPTDGETIITVSNDYIGFFVLTLNGLTLSPILDYTYTGNVVTLNAKTVSGDVISVIYTTFGGNNNLSSDNIYVSSPVVSGTTNNQGTNNPYFNSTTQKYEIYTTATPANSGSIIVMINGATLSNGVDYYQSTSNKKRIILEGDVVVGDVITIVYFPNTNVINGLITNNPSVSWKIDNVPQLVNGTFTLEVSSASTFSTIYSSSVQNYIVGQTQYYDSFTAIGTIGTKLYYRVKNEKNYVTICGDIITSTAYSDVIPVVVQTNSINSY